MGCLSDFSNLNLLHSIKYFIKKIQEFNNDNLKFNSCSNTYQNINEQLEKFIFRLYIFYFTIKKIELQEQSSEKNFNNNLNTIEIEEFDKNNKRVSFPKELELLNTILKEMLFFSRTFKLNFIENLELYQNNAKKQYLENQFLHEQKIFELKIISNFCLDFIRLRNYRDIGKQLYDIFTHFFIHLAYLKQKFKETKVLENNFFEDVLFDVFKLNEYNFASIIENTLFLNSNIEENDKTLNKSLSKFI